MSPLGFSALTLAPDEGFWCHTNHYLRGLHGVAGIADLEGRSGATLMTSERRLSEAHRLVGSGQLPRGIPCCVACARHGVVSVRRDNPVRQVWRECWRSFRLRTTRPSPSIAAARCPTRAWPRTTQWSLTCACAHARCTAVIRPRCASHAPCLHCRP